MIRERVLPIFCMVFLLMTSLKSLAQVTYKLTLDADKVTYRVFMRSTNTYTGTQARIGSAQVTIKVPHAAAPSNFAVGNLKGKMVNTNEMTWSMTRVDAPSEAPTFDYISFGFNSSISSIFFDIPANTDIELFNFKNTGTCTGVAELFNNITDPFKSPNSVNSNPGNSITIIGGGFTNIYGGNIGEGVNCQTAAPADLTVTATGSNTIVAGSATNLNLSVNNIGTASTSGNISLVVNLPTGITYNSFTGSGWNCSQSSSTVNCTTSSVINGSASASALSLSLTAATSISNGTSVSITGSVNGGGETNTSNNNFAWNPTVQNQTPNLGISITGSTSITAGIQTNYTINLNNSGIGASIGTYSVSTTIPVGMTYNSFTGNGWNVVATPQSNGTTIVLATSNVVISSGGNGNPLVLNVTPAANLALNTVLTINSTVTGGGDITPANNVFSFNSTISNVPSPNLSILVTGNTTVNAGSAVAYTFTINNSGSGSTSGTYTLSTTLPVGVSYNSFTGNGWNVVATPQSNGTTIITATSSTPINPSGNSVPLVINVTPAASLGNNSVLNIAYNLSGGGNANTVNNSFNITIINTSAPAFNVIITGSTNLTAGLATNYTFNISNTGNAPTSGQYTLQTTLPVGVSYNSFTGTGWNVVATPQPNGTTIITATSSTVISAGGTGNPLILNVTPSSTIPNNTVLTINNIISGGGTAGSGSFPLQITVVTPQNPNLTAVITGSVNPTAGSPTAYTISITNNGTGSTSGTYTIQTTLPVGISYNSFTGNGWNVVAIPQANGTTIITATSTTQISAGGSGIPLILNVTPSSTIQNNTALIINGNISGGGSSGSNNFQININVVSPQTPNLTATITGPTTVMSNNQLSYTINVGNVGTGSTSGTYTLTTTLPSGMIYNSFSGNNWSVVSSPQANGTTIITATSSIIINGGANAAPLVLNITTGNNLANNTILNITGNISGGGDNTPANNNYSLNITVSSLNFVDLSVNVSGNTTFTQNVATNITFNVNNSGTASSSGTYTLTATLPAGLTYSSFSGNGWSCTNTPQANGTTLMSCQNSTQIGSGNNSNSLIINVLPTNTLPINTTINITGSISGGNDSNGNNNNYVFSFVVVSAAKPDLTINHSGAATIVPNTPTTITINTNNIGSAASSGSYTISTTLPVGLAYNSFTGAGWNVTTTPQTNGSTILTAISSTVINSGSSGTPLVLNVTPANNLTNNSVLAIISAISGGNDGVLTNNSATSSLTVVANQNLADLTILITGSANVSPNVATNYTVNVSNVGFGATSGSYNVTITLPAGLIYNSFNGSGWNLVATPQSNGSTIITATSNTVLNAGTSATPIVLNVTPASNLSNNTSLIVYGLIAGGGDNSASNNSNTFTSTVISSSNPNLQVNINGPSTIAPASPLNLILNINNIGNGATSGTYSVITTLPVGVTYNSTSSSGWACSATPQANGTTSLSCQSNSLISANGSTILSLNLTTGSNLANNTVLNFISTVSGGGSQNPNTGTLNINVQTGGNAYLSVNITGQANITPNVPTSYTINVNNTGLTATNGIYSVTTIIPAGINYTGNTGSGSGWTCSSNAQVDGTTRVTCQSSQPIAPNGGAGQPIILNVMPTNSFSGTTFVVINSAVTGGGSTNNLNNFFNFYSQISNMTDLAVKISVSNQTPQVGQVINYSVVLTNSGPSVANNIEMKLDIPSNLINQTYTQILNGSPQGVSYNPSTGIWTISSLGINQNVMLTISGTVTQRGVFFATVEIMKASPQDSDSLPGNGSEVEDDLDRVCFTVPIKLCAGESYTVSVPSTYFNIQWKKNGVNIAGATSNSYTITEAGSYSFTSNTNCPKGGCCDIIVEQGSTPNLTVIQPSPSCNSINLTSVPVLINNNPTTVGLTYYSTQNDAQKGINPLTNTLISTSGTFWVRYQAFGECAAVGSITTNIMQNMNITSEPLNICAGMALNQAVIKSNNVPVTTGLTYYLSQNDAQLGTNPLTNLTVFNSGTYWVRYQATTGCFAITSLMVNVSTNKPSKPNVGDYAVVCPATSANLTTLQPANPSTVGGKFEWRIMNNPTSPLVNNPSAVTGGTYYLFEKGANGCYSDGDSVNITVTTCCKPNICVPFVISRN